MKYTLKTTPRFTKEFSKLDHYTQKMLQRWMMQYLKDTSTPYAKGKALKGNQKGFWRYRIGDYRLICEIRDQELIILAMTVGHRREIYE